MHTLRALFALLLATVLLVGLPADASGLKVTATTSDLAAIAAAVGGDHAEVTALSLHTQDPHWVDARPNLALTLSRADLLVLAGLDLEVGWLPNLLTGARNADIQPGATGYFDASAFVHLLQVPSGQLDRSQGDVHPGGNPHYTYDPRSALLIAPALADRMSQLDPDNADAYAANAAAFTGELTDAIERWRGQLAHLQGAPVIQFHRSWTYLEDWVGFELVGEIEPKPGVPPTPAHVARTVGLARSKGVKLVLKEFYFPDTTAALVAEKAGASLLTLPGGADFNGGQTYIERMDATVGLLAGEGM